MVLKRMIGGGLEKASKEVTKKWVRMENYICFF